jgi:hypothetical protein
VNEEKEKAAKETEQNAKSYLIKQGDSDRIKEFEQREEASRQSAITSISAPLSTEEFTREQMDEQRRARYARLQQGQEDENKKREDQARKAEVRDAFWKNQGPTNPNTKR